MIRECFKHIDIPHARSIVDAGANVCLSTIYLANRFPHAQITAIEIDIENFGILSKSTASLSNVKTLHKALWHRNTGIQISNSTGKKTAIRVEKSNCAEQVSIPTVTIIGLLNANNNAIDILKIDIEGAERLLFKDVSADQFRKIGLLVIELHVFTVEGCAHSFYTYLTREPFQQKQHGENLYITFPGSKPALNNAHSAANHKPGGRMPSLKTGP